MLQFCCKADNFVQSWRRDVRVTELKFARITSFCPSMPTTALRRGTRHTSAANVTEVRTKVRTT